MTRMGPTDSYCHNVREYNPLCGRRIYRLTNNAICVKNKLENDDTSWSDETSTKTYKQGRIQILNCPAESNRPSWTLPTFRIRNEHCNLKKRGDSKVCVGSKIRAKGTSCWKKLQQLFDMPCTLTGNIDKNTVVPQCPKTLIHSKNQLHCVKSTTTVCSSTNEDNQQEPCDVPAGYTRPKVLWQLVTNIGNLLPVAIAENPSCPETWVKLDTSLPSTHCPTDEIAQECQNEPDNQLSTCIRNSKNKETSDLDVKEKCQVLWPKSQDIIKLENKTANCTVNSEMKNEQCQLRFSSSENSKETLDNENVESSSNNESFFSDWWNKPVTLPDQFACNTPKLKTTATSSNQNNCNYQNSFESPMADRVSSGQSFTENVPPPEMPLQSLEEVQQGLLGRLIDIPGTPNSMSLFLPLNRNEIEGGARLLYSAPQEAANSCPSQKSRKTQTLSHNGDKVFGVWHSAAIHRKYPFLRLSAPPENSRNLVDSEYSTWLKCDTIDVSSRKTNKPHRVIGSTRLYDVDNFDFNKYSQLRYTNIKDKVLPEAQDRMMCVTALSASNNPQDDEKLTQTVCEQDLNKRLKTQDKPTRRECVTADSQNVGNSAFTDIRHDKKKKADGNDNKDQRTCNRCASRRGKPIDDPNYTDLSKIDNLSESEEISPEEIMKSWTPSSRKNHLLWYKLLLLIFSNLPGKSSIFQPSPDYVDLTLKDFSLKKYFPETSELDKKQELVSKGTLCPASSKSINHATVLQDKKETFRTTFWIELKPKTENMVSKITTLRGTVKDGSPKKKNQFFSNLGKNCSQHQVVKQTIQEPVYNLPEISILKDKTSTTSFDRVSKSETLNLTNSDSVVVETIHVGMPVAGSKQKILIPISIPTSFQQSPTISDEKTVGSRHRVSLKIRLANNTEEPKDRNR
ncbi:uncharacterized protein LOC107263064 isoform X2 [Cephus cinctus]|uniref:Uncharacterized protein LOC107263064 isoform X2 n=1 Tax=Cephus cinctus TaxID=211228 RepID=A0AAJ7FCR6_CEPCN|nr:uncharacterized protein LOC107263064 isoform X2 [Cephus cinctus]